MTRLPGDLFRGALLALAAGTVSWLIARFAFGRLYYLGALLPAAMVIFVLLAWILHLKSDGFFPSRKSKERSAEGQEERLFASFDEGVIPRQPAGPREARSWDQGDVLRALLWGALFLGLVSIALYHGAGIGARY